MATAYTNFGGSGPRIGLFQITTDLVLDPSRPIDQLVDGVTSSQGVFLNPTGQAVSGKVIFSFLIYGSSRVIDAFKIYQTANASAPSCKFQGWNGSSWTDLHSFNWPTASGATAFSFTNTTAYRAYRIIGVSGTLGNQNIYEIEFSTAANNSYEIGSRGGIITATTTLTNGSTSVPANVVDGDATTQSAAKAWWPNIQAVSGKEIKFQLSVAQAFFGAHWVVLAGAGNNGTWKWQGSNDGSSWTDLTSSFQWNFDGVASATPNYDNNQLFLGNTTAYLYYRMLGISGNASNAPYYTEVLFDGGTALATTPVFSVTGANIGVTNTGAGSVLDISGVSAGVLNTGVGSNLFITGVYVSVLTSLLPAGEITGDTNAGVHNDITEFDDGGGPVEPDPIVLETHFADEDGLTIVEINTNVGNPFKARFSDDGGLNVMITRSLQMSFTDDGGLYVSAENFTPIPVTQLVVIATGR